MEDNKVNMTMEEKKQGRVSKLFDLIKNNKIKVLILVLVGVTTATISYNMFKPPSYVYKQESSSHDSQAATTRSMGVPMVNPQEEHQRFLETAKSVYEELDLQISAEQQFLTKRELHDLGDLAIESKYWLDKDPKLERKFRPENLESFLEYDKENWDKLNQELQNRGLYEAPEWKLLRRGHENLVRDIQYLNEVSKRILIEE